MKTRMFATLGAAVALGGMAFVALAAKPANDVSVKMKVSDTGTWGPIAKITVKNLGTNAQNGVLVRVFPENEGNDPIWSDTVDVPARKSVTLTAHAILEEPAGVLVATASLDGATDEDLTDNQARVAMNLKGKGASLYTGRGLHEAFCAGCHEVSDTRLQGKNVKDIQAGANANEKFPKFNKTDAKNLLAFLKAPDAVVEPAPLPEMPDGGWPTYADDVKVLLDRCVSCHGGLYDDYESCVKSGKVALSVTAAGKMPPGKKFTSGEVQTLRDWIDGGRRE